MSSAQEKQEQMRQRLADMKAASRINRPGAPGSPSPGTESPNQPRAQSPIRRGGSRRGIPPGAGAPLAGGAPRGGDSRRGGPPRGSVRAPRGGATGPGAANAANAQRELGLVKTELKMLKMKYESEIRKREALEKQLVTLKEASNSPKTSRTRASMK